VGALQVVVRPTVQTTSVSFSNEHAESVGGLFHPVAPLLLGHVGRIVRALPLSQVTNPSSRNTSRWCHTVVVDRPTVLAISLTVVGWVLMTVVRTVSRDTERMLVAGDGF